MGKWNVSINVFPHQHHEVSYSVRIWRADQPRGWRKPDGHYVGRALVAGHSDPRLAVRDALRAMLLEI